MIDKMNRNKNKSNKLYVMFVIIQVLITACTYSLNKKSNKLIKKEDENFDYFYKRFMNEEEFQTKRIQESVFGYNSDEEDWKKREHYKWEKEEIKYYLNNVLKNDLKNTNTLKEAKTKSDTIKIIRYYVPNSGYETKLHFTLRRNKWFLKRFDYKNL